MVEADSRLLERYIRKTDAEAFESLSRRYRVMVFATARRITRNSHDAEDITQACFLELATKPETVRTSIPAYLHAAATRRALNLLRDNDRGLAHEQKAAGDVPREFEADRAAGSSWADLAPEVDTAVEELPEKIRLPIILFYLRGLDHGEIAQELGVARLTMRQRLKTGVRMIRVVLGKKGAVVSAGLLTLGLKAGTSMALPATQRVATGQMALAGLHRPVAAATGRGGRIAGSQGRLSNRGPRRRSRRRRDVRHVGRWRRGVPVFGPGRDGSVRRARACYGPELAGDSELGLTRRMATTIGRDSSSFWRGSQPLFFRWAKGNAADSLADRDDFVTCLASPDADDAMRLTARVATETSARLPVELELPHGLITVRVANNRDGSGSEAEMAALSRTLCESFLRGLTGPAVAPADDPDAWVREAGAARERFLSPSGTFRPFVRAHGGKVTDVLRSPSFPLASVDGAVAQALQSNARLANWLGAGRDTDRVRVLAACRRVRMRAVNTQSQVEVIALVRGGEGQLALLDVKQQLPSPARLGGLDDVPEAEPGRRTSEDADFLGAGKGPPVGWCEMEGESCTVRPLTVADAEGGTGKLGPVSLARARGERVGASHRASLSPEACRRVAARVTAALPLELARRSDAYTEILNTELDAFRADPRVARDQASQEGQLATWIDEAARAGTALSREPVK